MCGITGIFAHNFLGELHGVHVAAATQSLAHRGPDVSKLFHHEHVGMGHRRLCILDLSSAAHQPMTIGDYTLVFNGEIFNFNELRQELQKKGIVFGTSSDSEVLLQMLIHYGESCLSRLNGFFAFAFYDARKDIMLLARDHFGIKPLCYYHDEDKFIFGSEINSILQYGIIKEPDWEAIYHYFRFHYIPAPHTAFKGIKKLLPGHLLRVKKKSVEMAAFYDVPYKADLPDLPQTYELTKEKLRQLLDRAVQLRLVADVPVGTFLSGGIDSSLITALASRHTKKLKTFSIGFKDHPQYDESRFAAIVARRFQTEHTEFQVSQNDILDCAQAVLEHLGEPFADSSALPVYLLSRLTRQKVKVALSGDGADEVFAGYHRYTGEWMCRQMPFKARLIQTLLPLWQILPQSRSGLLPNFFRRLARFAQMSKLSPRERYLFMSSFAYGSELEGIFSTDFRIRLDRAAIAELDNRYTQEIEGVDFDEVLYSDVKTLLPDDMLAKVDLMSMAHGLEVRPPFLDPMVVNFAFAIPVKYKIAGSRKKIILQDIARELLPSEIFGRPKHGFDVPLYKAFRGVLSGLVADLLSDEFIRRQGIFDPMRMALLRKKIQKSTNYDQNHAWAVVVFQSWWKRNFQ